MKFTEYIEASSIWPTATNHTDLGARTGLVRGYNVEVIKDGKTDWLSCSWFEGEPDDYFNDEFHKWQCEEMGWEYTGRICFRGYGIEKWDSEERDYYIEDVEVSCEPEEPNDLELGFNPYMGCYDYDC